MTPSLEQRIGAGLGATTTFVTTAHFNLQTARSITVSDANGRASIYFATRSSNLIALAFIGQMSRLGAAFYAFALILLPALTFVRLVTFLRLVQSSMEDVACAHRIGLLRDFYLRVSPELHTHLLVVRGSIAAAVAGLALAAAGIQSLAVLLASGAVVGAGAMTLHQRHRRRARDAYTPEGLDRTAIFVPPSPQADTA